jgi:hypothetical protein
MVTVDANEAVASVAHRTNEVIAIYPITPSSAAAADGYRVPRRRSLTGSPGPVDLRRPLGRDGRHARYSGHWPLYRFDPRLAAEGKNAFTLDSKPPSLPLEEYLYAESRYRMLMQTRPEEAKGLLDLAKHAVQTRYRQYEQLAGAGEERYGHA